MNKLYYATGNSGKFQEVQQFFQKQHPEIQLEQYDADIPEIQTLDQKVIAIAKARKAWKRLQAPVLAEDAGVYFSRYNQFPGTMTKFVYQAIGMEGMFRLVNPGDEASFQLYLVYYYGDNHYEVFKGICTGTICRPEQFDAPESLPFNDIFIPQGSSLTYTALKQAGQLDPFNHRIHALKQFAKWYKKHMQK